MKSYVFEVVLEEDEFEDGRKAFHAYCPALESLGAATWGDTKEEALKNIREVVQMVIEELVEEGKQIPRDGIVAELESPVVVATV
ncbi:MAG: type II toxin-antitoxin system HicB family antitoxin [Acidobacteria bacterium]|nr:type II toxin-antitoxin system HicB family antitoxin [Acidobacteriota bacterium]